MNTVFLLVLHVASTALLAWFVWPEIGPLAAVVFLSLWAFVGVIGGRE